MVFYLLIIIFLKEVTMNIVTLLDSNTFNFAIFDVLQAVLITTPVFCSIRPYRVVNIDDCWQVPIHRPKKATDIKPLRFSLVAFINYSQHFAWYAQKE